MRILKKGQKQIIALTLAFMCLFSLLPGRTVEASENVEVVIDKGISAELTEGSNLGNKDNEINYINSFANDALTAHNEEHTSSQTVVNENKAIDVPKTDDNVIALLIVIGIMVLIAGAGTVILCKKYC